MTKYSRDKPEPVVVNRIHYLELQFTTVAVKAMVEADCKLWDRRGREIVPRDWEIETTSDYAGTVGITFSKGEGGPFSDEEVEPVRKVIEGLEETYWLLTRKKIETDD